MARECITVKSNMKNNNSSQFLHSPNGLSPLFFPISRQLWSRRTRFFQVNAPPKKLSDRSVNSDCHFSSGSHGRAGHILRSRLLLLRSGHISGVEMRCLVTWLDSRVSLQVNDFTSLTQPHSQLSIKSWASHSISQGLAFFPKL